MPFKKTFTEDLEYLHDLLKSKIPYAITRFGDGEQMIMEGIKLNLLHKGEFNYTGQEDLKHDLIHSFQLNTENYFVGIPCPCCQPVEKVTWMKESTYLPDSSLTWANIFVNGNYSYFMNSFIKDFNLYKTTFVGPGNIDNLPFNIDTKYQIGPDAWIHNKGIYEELRNQIITTNAENQLFLFCAGPFANILVSKLYKEFPKNTYLDLGSVFNIELGIGANRGYLSNNNNINKICIWN
jgi:hypothetical protein